jgi:hypothetical protein
MCNRSASKRIRLITAILHAAEAWMFYNMYAHPWTAAVFFASIPHTPAAKATALPLLPPTAVCDIGFVVYCHTLSFYR